MVMKNVAFLMYEGAVWRDQRRWESGTQDIIGNRAVSVTATECAKVRS
jgi:hypothetical protein